MSPINDEKMDERLDAELRRAAAEVKPRAAFVARLRAELNARQQAGPARRAPLWQRLRPYAGQGALLLALVGLVALALFLTPQLNPLPGQPVAGGTTTLMPGQPMPANVDGLPNGALARLGRGMILALDAAEDGRVAVGSTWGVCVFNAGLTADWCQPFGIAGSISRVAFSPDGKFLAVAHSDETMGLINVLDAASGESLARRFFNIAWPGMPMFNASSFAWDPSGQPRLAVSEFGGQVSAWDWQADRILWGPAAIDLQVQGDDKPAFLDWALNGQNQSVLAAGGENGLALLDGTSGAQKLRLPPTWEVAPVINIYALDLLADGRGLAYSYGDGPGGAGGAGAAVLELNGWQVSNHQLLTVEQQPSMIRWSQDADRPWLAMDSGSSLVQLFNDSGEPGAIIASRSASPLAWGPGDSLYYVRPEGVLGLYRDGQEVWVGLDFSSPPQRIAWEGDDRLVSLHTAAIIHWDLPARAAGSVGTVGLNATPLALSSDGRLALYRLSYEGGLTLWDTVNNRAVAQLEGGIELQRAAFSADGSRLVTAGMDGQLTVWDAFNGTKIRAMTVAQRQDGPHQQIDELALSPNGLRAALSWIGDPVQDPESGMENMVRLDVWDLERAEKTAGVVRPASINALAWSPDGRMLASAEGSTTYLHDDRLNRLAYIGQEPYGMVSEAIPARMTDVIRALAWSPDSKLLAVGGGLVAVYDVEQGAPALLALAGHRGAVRALAFHASGRMLASGSADGTILVWDLGHGPLSEPGVFPTATPLANPEGDSSAAPPYHLVGYNLQTHTQPSPDGRWQAMVTAGETPPGEQEPGTYHALRVTGPDGQDFQYEEWTSGTGWAWSEFKWWPNAPAAVYWYETMLPNGECRPLFNTGLRRMDLTTGEVSSVSGLDDSWLGYLTFSPDTPEVAYVGGLDPSAGEIAIRDLVSGAEQRAAFTPISELGWSVPWMVFLRGGEGVLLLQEFPPTPQCDARLGKKGVVLYERESGQLSQQEIPLGMETAGWDSDGRLQLVDPQGERFWMDIATGQIEPAGPLPEVPALDALTEFVFALAQGAEDPARYADAATHYGGDWSALAAQFPDVNPDDHALLLRQACERGGYACLPVRSVTMDTVRTNSVPLTVIYIGADEQDWALDEQTNFSFNVQPDAQGAYKVMNLPPRPPAADALLAFLELLAEDRQDAYAKAAGLYAGSPHAYPRFSPPSPPTDPAAFLRWACTAQDPSSGGPHHCQLPQAITTFEQLAPGRGRIWVQFAGPEGEPWPSADWWFPFHLLRGSDGKWRTADLPPSGGSLNTTAHLPDAETTGLDDAGILRALWQEYLEMQKTAWLPDHQRLVDFEITDVRSDGSRFFVTFSVRPAHLEASAWVAGNGDISADGWVRNKSLIIGRVQENGVSHLVIQGTGP